MTHSWKEKLDDAGVKFVEASARAQQVIPRLPAWISTGSGVGCKNREPFGRRIPNWTKSGKPSLPRSLFGSTSAPIPRLS